MAKKKATKKATKRRAPKKALRAVNNNDDPRQQYLEGAKPPVKSTCGCGE